MSRETRRHIVGARRAMLGLALSLTTTACVPMDDVMQTIFGRSMRSQPSFDPYENPLMPPVGAVSFSSGNYPAQDGQVNIAEPEGMGADVPLFTSTDMATGGGATNGFANPVPATAESLERGKVMYDRMCSVCHGTVGNPADAAILPKLPAMVAFPLASGGALLRSDGYIFGMITVGRGIMPPYGHQVSYYDRWHIVNYVRQLQGTVASPAPVPGAPAAAAPAAPGGEG